MTRKNRATCSLCLSAPEGHKHCHGECDDVKPFLDFYADNGSADGKTSQCQSCMKNRQNAKYVNDPEWRAQDNANSRAWWADKENSKAGKQRRKEKYPDRVANGRIFWKSGGLTLDGYFNWLTGQDDACGICGTLDPGTRGGEWFAIDHDHGCCDSQNSCGKCVRGIICNRCNTWVIPVYEGTRDGNIDALWVFVRVYMLEYAERRALFDAEEMAA